MPSPAARLQAASVLRLLFFHLALQKWPNIMLTAVETQSLRNVAIKHAHVWIQRAVKHHSWTLFPGLCWAESISLLFLHSSANETGWTLNCKKVTSSKGITYIYFNQVNTETTSKCYIFFHLFFQASIFTYWNSVWGRWWHWSTAWGW